MQIDEVWWGLDDDPTGNIQHLAANGVSREEAEEVLLDPDNETEYSRASGLPATFGWTSTGKHLIVIWERLSARPLIVYPITAFEVPPKAR